MATRGTRAARGAQFIHEDFSTGLDAVTIIGQLGFLWTADKLYVRLLAADSVRERPHSKDKKPRHNIREYHVRRKSLGLRHGDRLP